MRIILAFLLVLQSSSFRSFYSNTVKRYATIRSGNALLYESNTENDDDDLRKKALNLLDCLTSPKDTDDPLYDYEKDQRRDDLLRLNEYNSLKIELRRKGLKTSGDKLEMITRLLLHVVDPSINFDEVSGLEANLKYINEDDLKSDKIKKLTDEERQNQDDVDLGPDAEDLAVLRRRKPKKRLRMLAPSEDGLEEEEIEQKFIDEERRKLMLDGLIRKEVLFAPVNVKRPESLSKEQDWTISKNFPSTMSAYNKEKILINAYMVKGQDVLKTWDINSPALILIPPPISNTINPYFNINNQLSDGKSKNNTSQISQIPSWKAKNIRILADELAFSTQSLVIVPDLFRNSCYKNRDKREKLTNYIEESEIDYDDDRIFDDVLAVINYVRSEFGAKSISLAGTGWGAGKALELACDIHDIARYAVSREIEENSNLLLKNMNLSEFNSTDELVENEGFKALKTAVYKYNNIFRRVLPTRTLDLTLSKAEKDAEKQQEQELWESFEESLKNQKKLLEETDLNSNSTINIYNKEMEGTNELSDEKENLMDDMSNSEIMKDVEELLGQLDKVNAEKTKKTNLDQEDETMKEEKIIKTKYLFPDSSEEHFLVKEWLSLVEASNYTKSNDLIAEYSSLQLKQLINFVPSTVFSINAYNFDNEKVGNRLKIPTFFVHPEFQDDVSGSLDSTVKIFQNLKKRSSDILDFSFRIYEECRGDFVTKPTSLHDQICTQEAIWMGALWLEAFSSRDTAEFVDGVGSCQSTEDAFMRISKVDLPVELAPTTVAVHVHDEKDFFDRRDSDEDDEE